jgi:prefoldin subunit 5
MAFDFLGIFTKRDIDSLRTYLQGQLDSVDAQINHLVLETGKLQQTLSELVDYSNRVNVKFKVFDKSFFRVVPTQVDDTDSANLVQLTKQPFYPNIKFRDNIEHRIRKITDEVEQLQEKIHLLRISKSEFQTNFQTINSLFDNKHRYLTTEEVVT